MDKDTMDTPLPDQEQLAEALSAWMDGETLPEAVTEQQLWQWLRTDAQAQQLWHGWHAAGLCLRQPGTAMAAPVGASNWMEQLQHRLANAAPGLAAAPLTVGVASLQEQDAAGAMSQVTRPVITAATPVPAKQPAANDAIWRWRAAGGVASVLLVVAATWGWMGQRQPQVPVATVAVAPQPGGQPQPQAAPPQQQVQSPPPVPVEVQQQPPVLVAAQEAKPVAPAAEKSKPVAAAAVAVARAKPVSPAPIAAQPGVDEDDGLQALMMAHAQLGEQWLLQEAAPPEKDEVF